MAGKMFEEFVTRITDSWDKSQADLAYRVKYGTQPEIVMIGTSIEEILVANAFYIVILAVLYFWMSRRENDFKSALKPVITVYNAICVVLAGYVAYGYVDYKLRHWDDLAFVCNPNARDGEKGERLALILWVFAMQKYWEFCDTFFFILRKNFNQVSFLHVYHHASITFVVGGLSRVSYSGDVFLAAFLNACVHVCMYSHYLVTALGYRSWWSPYLTSMQLIQFLLIMAQSAIGWHLGPDCGMYDWEKLVLILYMVTMLVLFGQFFVNKYMKGGKAKPAPAAADKKEE